MHKIYSPSLAPTPGEFAKSCILSVSNMSILRTKTREASYYVMTKHNTFPGEQPEMPVPGKRPEIEHPNDPKEPAIPQEDPQHEPEEIPPVIIPPKDPSSIPDRNT